MSEPLCKSCVHPECEYAGKDVRLFICLHEYVRKPPTNADRIRAMSDEELASKLCDDNCPPGYRDALVCGKSGFDCEDCWLDWLQSPAEVTANESQPDVE